MPAVRLASFLSLIRLNLSVSVTFSALVAWLVCSQKPAAALFPAMMAIFLMAIGTSVLNQVQERKTDALMIRTRKRPVASGEISARLALLIACLLISSGMFLFILEDHYTPLLLGIINVVLYNGIYTPLKKVSTYTLIIGALTGAIPVWMGWTAAGGSIFDPKVLFIALFIFFWQIPHFWLLMLIHASDYKTAGIPAITDHLNLFQVKRLILIWLTAASITSLLLINNVLSHPGLFGIPLLIVNIVLLLITIYKFFLAGSESFRFLFILANTFLFSVLIFMLIERLLFPVNH